MIIGYHMQISIIFYWDAMEISHAITANECDCNKLIHVVNIYIYIPEHFLCTNCVVRFGCRSKSFLFGKIAQEKYPQDNR